MRVVLFISGSSQVGSTNWRLVKAAAALAEHAFTGRIEAEVVNLGALEIPRYDPAQAGESPLPEAVATLRRQLARSEAVFMSSDEYTGAYSTLFRNAAAWLAQDLDGASNLLEDKPLALCGASPGGVGGLRGHPSLQQFLIELGADVRSQKIELGTSQSPFDQHGRLLPKVERQLLEGALGSLVSQDA